MERLSIYIENKSAYFDELLFRLLLAKDIGISESPLKLLITDKKEFDKRFDKYFDDLVNLPSGDLQKKINKTLSGISGARRPRTRSFFREGIKKGLIRKLEIEEKIKEARLRDSESRP